jgi:DNA polymerase III sliding clamp (beta) subunit (PCNA family)
MDIFSIMKKLKPSKSMRYLCVEPGRVYNDTLGIQQNISTGLADGCYIVRVHDIPGEGSRFDGLAGDEIVLRGPEGATRRLPTEREGEAFLPGTGVITPSDAIGIDIPHKKTLQWVLSAMYADTTRESINALRVEGSSIIATDGHRLHEARLSHEIPVTFTVPGAWAKLLEKATRWYVTLDGRETYLEFEGGLTVGGNCSENFPDLKQVIPNPAGKPLETYTAEDLFAAHETAARLVKGTTYGARWEVRESTLRVSVTAPDVAWETTLTRDGAEMEKIGFNPRYVCDMAKGTKGPLVAYLPDATSAALFGLPALPGCDKRRAVIMPMRL